MKLLLEAWNANTLTDWGIAFAVAGGTLMALAVLRLVLTRVLGVLSVRTHTRLDDDLVAVVRDTRMTLFLPLALYVGSLLLEVPARLATGLIAVATVALLVQAAFWLNRFIRGWVEQQVARRRADGDTVMALALIGFFGRVVVWALIVLLILDQLNFDITALVAGLGIGGVAVALAVQNILGDLFASLSIFLDKPFVVGDFIIVGEDMGTVEQVGVKTTRVRALSGEIIVFPNGDLLKSRIRNMKPLIERRVQFGIGLQYDTPPPKIERAVALVKRIVAAEPRVRLDRAHFKGFGANSLDLEVVYFVLDPDYNLYMDIQQRVNLALCRAFADEGIALAHPSRTMQLVTAPPPDEKNPRPQWTRVCVVRDAEDYFAGMSSSASQRHAAGPHSRSLFAAMWPSSG